MTAAELDRVLAAGRPDVRAVLLVAAVVVGVAVILIDARRWPVPARQRVGLFLVVFASGLLGAYVPAFFAGGVVGEILRGGKVPMSILGSLAAAFLGAAVYKRAVGLSWDTSDAFARGVCLMMAVGRLGCHASHCCLGVKAAGWGLDFGDGCPRVPIQLVEAAVMFGLFGVFSVLEVQDRWPHRRLFLFFAIYGIVRFVLEFWREPMGASWHGLGSYQWFALMLTGLGLFQVVKRTRKLAREARTA